MLRTEQDFYDLAMDYFRVAKAMNVRYSEPFFDPQAHTRRGIELGVVMDGLAHAKADAESNLGVSDQCCVSTPSKLTSSRSKADGQCASCVI